MQYCYVQSARVATDEYWMDVFWGAEWEERVPELQYTRESGQFGWLDGFVWLLVDTIHFTYSQFIRSFINFYLWDN